MTSGMPPRGLSAGAANRAQLAVDSRTRPDSTGRDEDPSMTVSVLVKDRLCCVAGQGFEPWKAYADGFTVRSHWPLDIGTLASLSA